jgi:hypothetical protein
MARSFGIVEDKLREAEFFLSAFEAAPYLSYEGRFYFSAFVSAARSVTFAMQASLGGHSGFDDWYSQKQELLRADDLAPLFVRFRNDALKQGTNPIDVVPPEHLKDFFVRSLTGERPKHLLFLPDLQDRNKSFLVDAVKTSTRYFVSLVELVFECYETFKRQVDGKWHYTRESFGARGLSLNDALVELGFPPDWLGREPDEEKAWPVLRRNQPGCLINDIFHRHLGKTIDSPDDN